jgi:hypothetical protein
MMWWKWMRWLKKWKEICTKKKKWSMIYNYLIINSRWKNFVFLFRQKINKQTQNKWCKKLWNYELFIRHIVFFFSNILWLNSLHLLTYLIWNSSFFKFDFGTFFMHLIDSNYSQWIFYWMKRKSCR